MTADPNTNKEGDLEKIRPVQKKKSSQNLSNLIAILSWFTLQGLH